MPSPSGARGLIAFITASYCKLLRTEDGAAGVLPKQHERRPSSTTFGSNGGSRRFVHASTVPVRFFQFVFLAGRPRGAAAPRAFPESRQGQHRLHLDGSCAGQWDACGAHTVKTCENLRVVKTSRCLVASPDKFLTSSAGTCTVAWQAVLGRTPIVRDPVFFILPCRRPRHTTRFFKITVPCQLSAAGGAGAHRRGAERGGACGALPCVAERQEGPAAVHTLLMLMTA